MKSVPDTENGKSCGKKKKNGSDRSLHLYMRRMADGGLPLKMQSEKENKPSFWRAKSPESLLWVGKVKLEVPFPSAKGTAFGTVTGNARRPLLYKSGQAEGCRLSVRVPKGGNT